MDKQLEEEARLQRAVFPVLPHPSGTSTHTGNNELPSLPEVHRPCRMCLPNYDSIP